MAKFNKEEKEIFDSYEKNEWASSPKTKTELKLYKEYARNTFNKDKRINIRISTKDLEGIRLKAINEGIPYQTLISSVLHKYVSGRLFEKSA